MIGPLIVGVNRGATAARATAAGDVPPSHATLRAVLARLGTHDERWAAGVHLGTGGAVNRWPGSRPIGKIVRAWGSGGHVEQSIDTVAAGYLAAARRYLAALETGATGAALAAFFDPAVVQEEFPNRLMPHGARRDLAGLLDAALRGQQVMAAQTFAIRSALAAGDQVAIEFVWTGTLKVALATLPAGARMTGRFATFIEFRAGRIVAQRSYDCFDPW
jgi:ketosteroid isomerase-like protein